MINELSEVILNHIKKNVDKIRIRRPYNVKYQFTSIKIIEVEYYIHTSYHEALLDLYFKYAKKIS